MTIINLILTVIYQAFGFQTDIITAPNGEQIFYYFDTVLDCFVEPLLNIFC